MQIYFTLHLHLSCRLRLKFRPVNSIATSARLTAKGISTDGTSRWPCQSSPALRSTGTVYCAAVPQAGFVRWLRGPRCRLNRHDAVQILLMNHPVTSRSPACSLLFDIILLSMSACSAMRSGGQPNLWIRKMYLALLESLQYPASNRCRCSEKHGRPSSWVTVCWTFRLSQCIDCQHRSNGQRACSSIMLLILHDVMLLNPFSRCDSSCVLPSAECTGPRRYMRVVQRGCHSNHAAVRILQNLRVWLQLRL